MIKKNEKTKIDAELYLDDHPLVDGSNDRFESQQVAEVMRDSIIQSTLPLHISLLGKWGSGKTTTIKILKSILDKNYKLKVISVWKFADDSTSLHRKIVRETEKELGIDDVISLDERKTKTTSVKSTGPISSLMMLGKMEGIRKTILFPSIIFLIISLLTFLLPFELQFFTNNILLLLFVGFIMVSFSKETGIIASRVDEITPLSLKHSEQYENRFQLAVERYLGKNKSKKLILVFDDLDRLPPKQLYGALNTIKTFLSSNRCAFIIPCDESVLKEELKEAFDEKEMKSFDVTEYLNKTFDLTIRLPELEPTNMSRYAKNLLVDNGILWYRENNEKYKEILFILIHSNVTTPRHVKKILNAYAADWELAKKRDQKNSNGKYLTATPEVLAIFTVLKSDFSNFYGQLSNNPYLISSIIEENYSAKEFKDIEVSKGLFSFLKRVEDLIQIDTRPYIYFNNQQLNPLTGRVDLEEIKQFILNGQLNEFSEKYDDVSTKDINLVFSSVLQEVDSSIAIDNLFSIFFNYPETSKVMDVEDGLLLSELINYNIDKVVIYSIKDTLKVFNNIINQPNIWNRYQNAVLNLEEKYLELFRTHIEEPELFTKLSSSALFDLYNKRVIQLGLDNDDIKYVSAQIIDLPTTHPLNNGIRWYDSLEVILNHLNEELSDSDEEIEVDEEAEEAFLNFNLSDWLRSVDNKSAEKINVRQINNILEKYHFGGFNSLEGIISVWIERYQVDGDIDDIKTLLNIIEENYTNFISNSEFENLGNLLTNNGEGLEEEINSLLVSTINNSDEKYLKLLINYTKNTIATLKFSLDEINFKGTGLNESYLKVIVNGDQKITEELLEILMKKISNQVFKQNVSGDTDLFLCLIKQSEKIFQESLVYKDGWFDNNNEFFWFKWDGSENQYYKRAEIYVELDRDNDPWIGIVKSMVAVISRSNNIGYISSSYSYRNQWQTLINSLFSLMIDKCDKVSNWEAILAEFNNIAMVNNSSIVKSAFEFINKELLSAFLNKVPKYVDLDNNDINKSIFDYANFDNSTHFYHTINRWNYFTLEQRTILIAKIPEEKLNKLVDNIEKNPELKYISELAEYSIADEEKEDIVSAIISEINIHSLNDWLAKVLLKFSEKGIDYWATVALEKMVNKREDVSLPNPDVLEPLFSFKDERTDIVLNLIINFLPEKSRNKKEYRGIKEGILLLEGNSRFNELVLEAKRKFRWRNTFIKR